jgi:hypothetical protein
MLVKCFSFVKQEKVPAEEKNVTLKYRTTHRMQRSSNYEELTHRRNVLDN